MKNVYHDYEIENDTVESGEAQDPLPQFKKPEAKKKRRVEFDQKGRVRQDTSMRIVKAMALVVVLVLVSVYAFHTCGAQIFGIR